MRWQRGGESMTPHRWRWRGMLSKAS